MKLDFANENALPADISHALNFELNYESNIKTVHVFVDHKNFNIDFFFVRPNPFETDALYGFYLTKKKI